MVNSVTLLQLMQRTRVALDLQLCGLDILSLFPTMLEDKCPVLSQGPARMGPGHMLCQKTTCR